MELGELVLPGNDAQVLRLLSKLPDGPGSMRGSLGSRRRVNGLQSKVQPLGFRV